MGSSADLLSLIAGGGVPQANARQAARDASKLAQSQVAHNEASSLDLSSLTKEREQLIKQKEQTWKDQQVVMDAHRQFGGDLAGIRKYILQNASDPNTVRQWDLHSLDAQKKQADLTKVDRENQQLDLNHAGEVWESVRNSEDPVATMALAIPFLNSKKLGIDFSKIDPNDENQAAFITGLLNTAKKHAELAAQNATTEQTQANTLGTVRKNEDAAKQNVLRAFVGLGDNPTPEAYSEVAKQAVLAGFQPPPAFNKQWIEDKLVASIPVKDRPKYMEDVAAAKFFKEMPPGKLEQMVRDSVGNNEALVAKLLPEARMITNKKQLETFLEHAASHSITIEGQKMTDARAREFNANARNDRAQKVADANAAGKPLSSVGIKSLDNKSDLVTLIGNLHDSFKDEFAGHTLTGGLGTTLGGLGGERFGLSNEGQHDWWNQFQTLKNDIRHGKFGSAISAREDLNFNKESISESTDPTEARKFLKRLKTAAENSLERESKVYEAGGFSQRQLNEYKPAVKAGSGVVRMVHPSTGEVGEVSRENVAKALANGYKEVK